MKLDKNIKEALSDKHDEIENETFDINRCLSSLGGFGLFQFLALYPFVLPFFANAIFILSIPLFWLKPQYTCNFAGDDTKFSCLSEDFCNNDQLEWEIDWSQKESLDNLIVKFDAHCASGLQIGSIGGLYFFSMIVGTWFTSLFSNKMTKLDLSKYFGSVLCIGVAVMIFSNTFTAYYIGLFIASAFVSLRFISNLLYLMDLLEDKNNYLIPTFSILIYSLVQALMAVGMIYYHQKWQIYYWLAFALFFIAWFASFFLPESPREMISRGRYEKAEETFRTIFRVNSWWNKELKQENLQRQIDLMWKDKQNQQQEEETTQKLSLFQELAANKRNLLNFCLLVFVNFGAYFNYYSQIFITKYLNGSLFFNYFFIQITDSLGCFVYAYIVNYFGWRKTYNIGNILTLVGMTFLIIFHNNAVLIPVMLFISNIGIASLMMLLAQLNHMWFNARIAASTMAYLTNFGNLGGLLQAFVCEVPLPYPLLVICLFSVVMLMLLQVLHRESDSAEDNYKSVNDTSAVEKLAN